MRISSTKVDAAKIEAGAWIGNIPEMGDLELQVRGLGNADYRRLRNELTAAVPRAKWRGNRLDPAEEDRITAICLNETILTNWRNLEDEKGSPLRHSKKVAEGYLTDPNFRRFREAVIYAATIVGEEDEKAAKEDEGNSPIASAGP